MGTRLHTLMLLPDEDTRLLDIAIKTQPARKALYEFVFQTVFRSDLAPVERPAAELLNGLDKYEGDIVDMIADEKVVGGWEIRSLKDQYRVFENVLYASLRTSQIYYVSPKGGYSTLYLTEAGELLFSADLGKKVPGAVSDLREAAKCIAFELPTAAGFHLHRANEAVFEGLLGQCDRESRAPE